MKWLLTLICCGRYAGTEAFTSWSQADSFRESYTSGPGVEEHGYSGNPYGSHQRAAVLTGPFDE